MGLASDRLGPIFGCEVDWLEILHEIAPKMTSSSYEVTFNPNPVQKAFIESRADADLFSSRFGEGKTAGLCWAIFYHTRENPGANWAMIRDTWTNLQATTLEEFLYWFPAGIFGDFNKTEKVFTWRVDGMGEGKVRFIGMDDPADAAKLQSLPLAGAAFDEAAPATQSGGIDEAVFDIALGRLRQAGMKRYAVKVATNNPDETHWTYRRFVDPGTEGFKSWQPTEPENITNLPEDYYEKLRSQWAHRPDFIKRFLDGQYGFTQLGRQVTPEWNDSLHLATGLAPVRGVPLTLLWDFGHNPTCLITQVTPLRHWNILESHVGEDMGVEELIEGTIKGRLAERFRKFSWKHVGDPAGTTREQTSIQRSAVKAIRGALGGSWRSGPVKLQEGLDPLKAILRQSMKGIGVVRVDRVRAKEVRDALRGGWHYHVARSGVISSDPQKDHHSHPGDAMRYGAAVLFPIGKLLKKKRLAAIKQVSFFESGPLGIEKPGLILPPEARKIGS